MKLPETSKLHVLWRKCRTCCCLLFVTLSFSPWWPLGFLIFSPPLKNVHVVLPTNSSLSSALAFSVAIFLVELCWPVAHFIFLYIPNLWTWQLIQAFFCIKKQFPLFVFVFIDSLVVSASQDAGGYAISRQNNLELHLGCHTCWLSYFTLVCLWCGRTVGREYGHVITKISRMGRLPNFLTHGAPLRALRASGAPLWMFVENCF